MRILIAYVSPNGTTAAVAGALNQELAAGGQETRLLDLGRPGTRPREEGSAASSALLDGVDIIGIGGPVYHLRLLRPAMDFLEAALSGPRPVRRVFAFATYGGVCSGGALLNAARLAADKGAGFVGALKVTAPHFYKHEEFPGEAARSAVSGFAAALADSSFAPLPASRTESALALRGKRRLAYRIAPILGRMRRLPITVDPRSCRRCGRCASECPVGAIRLAPLPGRDGRSCLYCYHCAIACPTGAIACPTDRLQVFVRANERLLGREEPACGYFTG